MRRITTALTAVSLMGVLASCGSAQSQADLEPTPVSPGAPAAKGTGKANAKNEGSSTESVSPSSSSSASADPTSESEPTGSEAVKDRAAPSVPLAERSAKPAKPTASASKGSLNGTVVFSDGVRLKMTDIKNGKAEQKALPGNFPNRVMTTFTVKLSNGSKVDLDANSVIVTATYGDSSKVATPVFDEAAKPFAGVISPKASETAIYSFNIPAAERGNVTLRFDLDGKHSMATFTGKAA